MAGFQTYGQILESAKDISRCVTPFVNAYPSARELETKKENVDNELMPPPIFAPIKRENVPKDKKKRTRSCRRNETTTSNETSSTDSIYAEAHLTVLLGVVLQFNNCFLLLVQFSIPKTFVRVA